MTGPILFLDDIGASGAQLSALFIAAGRARPEPVRTVDGVHAAERLADYDHATVWRARFHLPADRPSSYQWSGESYDVGIGTGQASASTQIGMVVPFVCLVLSRVYLLLI